MFEDGTAREVPRSFMRLRTLDLILCLRLLRFDSSVSRVMRLCEISSSLQGLYDTPSYEMYELGWKKKYCGYVSRKEVMKDSLL